MFGEVSKLKVTVGHVLREGLFMLDAIHIAKFVLK